MVINPAWSDACVCTAEAAAERADSAGRVTAVNPSTGLPDIALGAIVGVVGTLVLIAVIGVIMFLLRRSKARKNAKNDSFRTGASIYKPLLADELPSPAPTRGARAPVTAANLSPRLAARNSAPMQRTSIRRTEEDV